MPAWMVQALAGIDNPRYFVKGAAGLVELACRSPEHVARSVQKFLKKTPSAVVNEARISYAVKQLSLSTKSIYEIAFDCGFESIARFYQLFKKQTGMPPKQYQNSNRRIVA